MQTQKEQKEWSTLAKVVYRRTYSRKKADGTNESWADTVNRVVEGNIKGFNVPPTEVERLKYFILNRKAVPGGRGLWMSGVDVPKIKATAQVNCGIASTKLFTDKGWQTFGELCGEEANIYSPVTNSFTPATIYHHGKQDVYEYTFANVKGNSKKIRKVQFTENHKWLLTNGKTTESLKVGDVVPTAIVNLPHNEEAFIHGMIFGDGSLQGESKVTGLFTHRIRLCGEKVKYLSLLINKGTVYYFPSTNGEPTVVIKSNKNLKTLPKGESPEYIASFIKGWASMDGSFLKGRSRIHTTNKEAILFFEEYAPFAGFVITGDIKITTSDSNFGKRKPLYEVSFQDQSSFKGFKVISKTFIGERDVYCPFEPENNQIVIDNGIHTYNCWFWTADKWKHFVYAMDYLMTGGGVGMSVEHRYVSKLPEVKKVDYIRHIASNDADFIVPDSREGWCALIEKVLDSYFVTGKSFTYSTICIRQYGEPIKGFGGTASGPFPLIKCVEKLVAVLNSRSEHHIRPIDAGDIITCIGEMVVAGNVRRSAIILLGDPWDREYLAAKNWALGNIPNNRAFANYSIVANNFEDIHPDFWLTYENGEPFGIVNRKNIQTYGRMGEKKKDKAIGVNPCGEIGLENGEPCNIADLQLQNISSVEEMEEAACLMFRYMKRVTLKDYHNPISQEVIHRNMRVGLGLTGFLMSPLATEENLNRVYKAIQDEDEKYSAELGVSTSIRTTTIKPAGTVSKVCDAMGYEGIHPAFSRYMIQRIRVAANDPLIPLLREAGHHIEPVVKFDGEVDHDTLVVDFYQKAPDDTPVADEDWTMLKQLDVVKKVQRWWSDNSVSVTVYYKKEEIPLLKQWLKENLKEIKTISFLCHSEHGFKQAPKEAVSREVYEAGVAKLKPLALEKIEAGAILEDMECAGGVCPVR